MLRTEITPFIDANGLVAPNIPGRTGRGSDNGPLFTSQLYLLLLLRNELEPGDREHYAHLINRCIDTELRRAPGLIEPDEIDDYTGVFAARNRLGLVDKIKLNLPFRLWRMPQVLFLRVATYWKWYNPIHVLTMLYAAGTIVISCRNSPLTDTDARILAWLLIQGTSPYSLLCRLAAKVWYRRLYKDYGDEPMQKVAAVYFWRDNHPFPKYWVSKPDGE